MLTPSMATHADATMVQNNRCLGVPLVASMVTDQSHHARRRICAYIRSASLSVCFAAEARLKEPPPPVGDDSRPRKLREQ